MDGSGYIKLYRKFLEWEWYDDDNCTRLFIHCLLKANYRDKQWRGKTILRGQFFTSIENLSKELHLTSKQIRIALSKLENTGEISKKGANEGTYITVCNYDSYQQAEQVEGQTEGERRASEGQTKGKRRATTKKDKNIKNERNVIPPTLEMVKRYCAERKNKIDPVYFIDWNQARGWTYKKTKMTDWQAAIRTWERNDNQSSSNYNQQPQPYQAPIQMLPD